MIRGTTAPAAQPCYSEVDFVPSLKENAEKTKKKRAVVARDFKLVHDLRADSWQLYDLVADPGEREDVYGRPEHAEAQRALSELHRRYRWHEIR